MGASAAPAPLNWLSEHWSTIYRVEVDMDVTFTVSLVVGAVSIVLAVMAIWPSIQSERRSMENYDRTKDILSEISEKAAVIEGTVSKT